MLRDAGFSITPKAKMVYLPLIDNVPYDQNTMLTAIQKGLFLADKAQAVLVFTVDQQLYKVIIDIICHTPSYFKKVFRCWPSYNSFVFPSLITTSGHSNQRIW